jgi:3-dehydroquinate dehydratase-2
MLGKREPTIYGNTSFEEYFDELKTKVNCELGYIQSNYEGDLITEIQQAKENGFDGIVLNAGAYTHTSIAIHDAILSVDTPVVEVHISNVYKRETYRHTSFLSPVCVGTIVGFGLKSYEYAVDWLTCK